MRQLTRIGGANERSSWWRMRGHAVVACGIFILTWLSPLDYSDADAAMMLVAAQGLLEHGHPGFEPYANDSDFEHSLDRRQNYRLREWPWGLGYYSLGAPIVVTPAVWVANRLGLNMVERSDESNWQNFLSAVSCAVVFVLSHSIARTMVSASAAIGLAASVVLGSSLVSSLGTALWTNHFAVIAAVTVLWMLLRFHDRSLGMWGWGLLAMVVLVATVCRPGSAFLGVLVGGACVLRGRRGTRWLWAGALLLVAILTSGWWSPLLPFYYSPSRVPLVPTLDGLAGVLFSPSRGLFVFSPMLIMAVPLGWLALRADSGRRAILIATTGWLVVNGWFVAAMPMWWGGHSFGPRLLVDVIPGFLVLIAAGWSVVAKAPGARIWAWVLCALAIPSVLIHSGSGLFNRATQEWNVRPNIDFNRELLWNWRYPQFLASADRLRSREIDVQASRLEPYEIGRMVTPDSAHAIFDNWYGVEDRWRWSRGASAAVIVRLGSIPRGDRWQLVIVASSLDRQDVAVRLDGSPIGTIELTETVSEHLLTLDSTALTSKAELTIDFQAASARRTPEDPRILGLALWSLRIEEAVILPAVRLTSQS